MSEDTRPDRVRHRVGLLEALIPGLVAHAPRLELANLPTPVVALPDLAARFGLAELLVKRDDVTSPLFGGTKVRGLEFFLGRARALGFSGVVTLGSAGSNHVVATAVFAREAGVAARAVLFPHPDEAAAARNVARLVSLGADVRRAGWIGVLPALARGRLEALGGGRPLWIAPGGSSALGVLGAAEGALEVVAAARASALTLPEDVVVAAGSCGTAAGLALGFALAGVSPRIFAVRVVPRMVATGSRIRRLTLEGLSLLGRAGFDRPTRIGPLELIQTQAGAGYARPTGAALESMTIAHDFGIHADPTYTGKAWAHVFSGAFRGRRVLFWNTFGSGTLGR